MLLVRPALFTESHDNPYGLHPDGNCSVVCPEFPRILLLAFWMPALGKCSSKWIKHLRMQRRRDGFVCVAKQQRTALQRTSTSPLSSRNRSNNKVAGIHPYFQEIRSTQVHAPWTLGGGVTWITARLAATHGTEQPPYCHCGQLLDSMHAGCLIGCRLPAETNFIRP